MEYGKHAVTLFELSLARKARGMAKGPVRGVPAHLVGHRCAVTGVVLKPDPDAVRACLPANYRIAYDRARIAFWFDKHDNSATAVLHLYNAKGERLNTVYAKPYVFDPK